MLSFCHRTCCLFVVGSIFAAVGGARPAAQEKVSDWPQFRGPGGTGISDARRLPTTWSADKNILWKIELPGPGTSSPIVVGEKVFLTCYSGYGHSRRNPGDMEKLQRHVLCVSRSEGKVLWKIDVKAELPETPFEEDYVAAHGYATSTPVADAEHVYVFFGKSGVYAFTHGGKQIWHSNVGAEISDTGSGASPLLYRDLVIVNASVESNSLVALERATGKEAWRTRGVPNSWATPLLIDVGKGKLELVLPIEGRVLGFDPASGEQLWSCRAGEGEAICSPAAGAGAVYFLLGRSGPAFAVRAGGRGDVRNTHALWSRNTGHVAASPLYDRGHLYFVSRGIAHCLNADTGEVVYQARLNPATDEVYASPVLADGKLFYVAREGGAYVLAAGPKFQQLAHNDLGDHSPFNASPAVSGNCLLLRSDRYLYCLGQK